MEAVRLFSKFRLVKTSSKASGLFLYFFGNFKIGTRLHQGKFPHEGEGISFCYLFNNTCRNLENNNYSNKVFL